MYYPLPFSVSFGIIISNCNTLSIFFYNNNLASGEGEENDNSLALSCGQDAKPKACWPAAADCVINVFVAVCGEK